MNSITKYKFADLYEMSSGISTTKEQAGHGAPFVSFSTVFNNYFLPETLPDKMNTTVKDQGKFSVKKGDILITRTSETLDELAMSCVSVKDYPEATFSGFVKRLRPKTSGIAYYKFMAFYLRSKLFRETVTNNAIMTLRASFNEDIFSFLNLYLPPYDEQVKIGNLLYNIEMKMQNNNKINDNIYQKASLLYDYWFNQFDFPDKTGNPYKSSDNKMEYNLLLKKEIPMNFNVLPIKELLDVITGKKDANYATNNGKYHFFTCSREVSFCDEYAFNGKAILIAGNGDFNVKHYTGKFNAYQRTYVLIPREEKYYALIYFAAQRLINTFKNGSNGSIVKFITKSDVENILITVPDTDVYLDVLNDLLNKIEMNQKENQELRNLRDWLLPMLMTGQSTVVD